MRVDVRGAASGVLLVDKSAGPTSHDVVARARRALGTRRIGHTGTLDPFATGLLVLCIGRATRLTEYFHLPEKRYEAELRLGVETTSHDPEGEIVGTSEAWREIPRERLIDALTAFEGPLDQRPPALSAKKVKSRRAHELVRSGAEPRLAPARITIHSLELLSFEPPTARLSARVSTGTYMRALARDLGRELGCGAHLTKLRRTAIDGLLASGALSDEELGEGGSALAELRGGEAWREPGEALSWLASRAVSDEEVARVRSGLPIQSEVSGQGGPTGVKQPSEPGGAVRLLHEGRLIAVAEVRERSLQPRKVFVD